MRGLHSKLKYEEYIVRNNDGYISNSIQMFILVRFSMSDPSDLVLVSKFTLSSTLDILVETSLFDSKNVFIDLIMIEPEFCITEKSKGLALIQ